MQLRPRAVLSVGGCYGGMGSDLSTCVITRRVLGLLILSERSLIDFDELLDHFNHLSAASVGGEGNIHGQGGIIKPTAPFLSEIHRPSPSQGHTYPIRGN